jgi:hypothetical protein
LLVVFWVGYKSRISLWAVLTRAQYQLMERLHAGEETSLGRLVSAVPLEARQDQSRYMGTTLESPPLRLELYTHVPNLMTVRFHAGEVTALVNLE